MTPGYLRSRAAYDDHVASWPADQRWQWWPVPWRLATPRERAVKLVLWAGEAMVVVSATLALAMFAGVLMESYSRGVELRDRCFKAAATGFEIRDCYRGRMRVSDR